jgi:tetratricopeptide (TPR) repeat protein
MAKQRPKSKSHQPASSPIRHARAAPLAASPQSSSTPQRRSTYFEAVAVYERAVEAVQRRHYQAALDLLNSVLRLYPEEKELHERVKLYLNVCERHAMPAEPVPSSVNERLYAATLALNGGQYDEALSHLRLVRDEDPDNEHALYMLAVAHAQRDEHAEAIAHLERAIALNPENRAHARHDPDLEPLRDDEAFQAALDAPSSTDSGRTPERRRPVRPRSAR